MPVNEVLKNKLGLPALKTVKSLFVNVFAPLISCVKLFVLSTKLLSTYVLFTTDVGFKGVSAKHPVNGELKKVWVLSIIAKLVSVCVFDLLKNLKWC